MLYPPLWKMMELKSVGMKWNSQLLLESHNPVMFQTTNQEIWGSGFLDCSLPFLMCSYTVPLVVMVVVGVAGCCPFWLFVAFWSVLFCKILEDRRSDFAWYMHVSECRLLIWHGICSTWELDGTGTSHIAWYFQHFGAETSHFALNSQHFGTWTSHLTPSLRHFEV